MASLNFGLSSDISKALKKPGIHWLCTSCEDLQIKIGYHIVNIESTIDKLNDFVTTTLKWKLSGLEQLYEAVLKKIEN